MAAGRRAPGQGVTAEEVNYLSTRLRDLRADLETVKRHQNMSEERLGGLEEAIEGLVVEDVIMVDDEEEASGLNGELGV